MRNVPLTIAAISCLATIAACDRSDSAPSSSAPAPMPTASSQPAPQPPAPTSAAGPVLTTFYPTTYFAQRIAGGLVPIECPLPPDTDAIFWQPDRATLARYQNASLIIINGAEFEKWVAGASLPLSRVCDSALPFKSEYVKFDTIKHSHGAAGAHAHEGTDGHTWLDPINAARQVQQITTAMSRAFPAHEKAFRDNAQKLAADLATLDARYRELAPKLKGARLLANHPAYNYLAKRYALSITNFDVPPDEPPAHAELAKIEAALISTTTKPAAGLVLMLFEAEPAAEVRAALTKLGVVPVTFEPAESIDPAALARGDDYLKIMNRNIDNLHAALPILAPAKPATHPSN